MTIDIDAIRQREQAATPGPWTADGWEIYEHPTRNWVAETLDTDDHDRSIADAEFIAHARQDIPALLDELRRADDALVDARYTIDQVLSDKNAALARVADLADKLHKAETQVHSLEKATTAYANENDRLKHELSQANRVIASLRAEIDEYDAAEVAR